MLRGFLGLAKDGAVSAAARAFLAARLAPYGEMLNFSINSAAKTISLEVLLKGEDKPLSITLKDYELLPGEPPQLRVGSATASREWVETVLKEFVVGRAVDLPPKALPLLRLLI